MPAGRGGSGERRRPARRPAAPRRPGGKTR